MAMELIPGPNPVFGTFTVVGNITSGTINGVTLNNNAWSTYVPVITAGSGTFTNTNSAGRYKQIGKTVFIELIINIVTSGSAGGYVLSTIPINANSNCILCGRENAITGYMLQGLTNSNSVLIISYINTAPIGDGYQLILSGVYESV